MKTPKIPHPEWALKFRTKGTELRRINGRYYLYSVTSKWDKERKVTKKITLGMIGAITEQNGLTPKGSTTSKKVETSTSSIDLKARPTSSKEFGATSALLSVGSDILSGLRKYFPLDASVIFTLAMQRLLYQSPLKNMEFYYLESFLSEQLPGLNLNKNHMTELLKKIGSDRESVVKFMKQLSSGASHIAFDTTHIISQSKNLGMNYQGYNSVGDYEPQVNLFYLFAVDQKKPVYFRLIPGNISGLKALKLTIEEAGLEKSVLIGDKGLASEANIQWLEEVGLDYILPLRRNSRFMDTTRLESRRYQDAFDGHFFFQKRSIFYYSYVQEGQKCMMFVDSKLRAEEERDYLRRIQDGYEGYDMKSFRQKELSFGSILLVTNIDGVGPEEIYIKYKTRMEVETMFDVFKNTIEADRTYMQSQESLEGWLLINHVATVLYYELYARLKEAKLLAHITPSDLLLRLARVSKIKIGDKWVTAEINSKTSRLLTTLNLSVT
ncbi:MAG: transposase [Rickettsiaceae bacterium]|nr:transposase [Rickettsiaceae bacterium]